VFHSIWRLDIEGECTRMLEENWRMNEILCSFSSNTIYKHKDRKYKSANDDIASQTFFLKKLRSNLYSMDIGVKCIEFEVQNDLLNLLFDPDKPLILINLEIDVLKSQGIYPHSPIIAGLIQTLYLLNTKLHPEEKEDNFWKRRLLVVAPHHAQRKEIKKHIKNTSFMWHNDFDPKKSNIGILTVEKAQGQEVDTVIVDYGMKDLTQIKKELNFIYSRNRLNVSITRAKRKCLVIFTDTILTGSNEIFDQLDTEEGFIHMQSLYDFAKKNESILNIKLSDISEIIQKLSEDYNNIKHSINNSIQEQTIDVKI